ncbi:MAG: Nitrite reductase (NAD(P)H) [Desulfotomaculum sp. 46_296]|nr:MAG: Nitrite reductase (NAD(P)H) [Desulfotomaculum sp. 46_296]KUK84453.1 MAG: Nitrite reductase (NAD(P)H) [Desulfofundulus kuznetsovii]HAU32044.1 NAD(P)/FAD-dependent oxidoreductase [Desulfotomaculum sp.]
MIRQFDYVVIGNSAGSVGCIEMLRSIDRSGSIALIAEETRRVYSRALLPYYLAGGIDLEKMYYRKADFYEQHGVTALLGQKAVHIDTDKKEALLSGNERIVYKKLLLATGGRPLIPPVEGLDRENIFTFLSMDDVLKIEKALENAQRAVVLGGGVIGLMAAEALCKRGLQVQVIELAGRVLAPVVDEPVSNLLKDLFIEKGVQVITNNTIKEIKGGSSVESVVLTDGTQIPCDMLVLAMGVAPRIKLGVQAGLQIDRGILVNERMETSRSDLYACGDCAQGYDSVAGISRVIPLWPNAYLGGRIAGSNMAGGRRENVWSTSMNSMHFFDLCLITAGLNISAEDPGGFINISRIDEKKKYYRKFTLREGRIAGFILAGRISRAGIFVNLMRTKADVSQFTDDLFNEDFGYGSIPEELRWELLKEDLIPGVVNGNDRIRA